MKRDIGSQVLMFPGFLMVFYGFLEFPRLRNPWKLKCPNTDGHAHVMPTVLERLTMDAQKLGSIPRQRDKKFHRSNFWGLEKVCLHVIH